MASWLSRLSWLSVLSRSGFTQICVARGSVSWESKDNDATGELQLWCDERDNNYCLYASKTAGDDMTVCNAPINVKLQGGEAGHRRGI